MSKTKANETDAERVRENAEQPVKYSLSNGLVARLASLSISIAFTSYRSGILYFLGRNAEGAHLHQSHLPKPMGLFVDRRGALTLASGAHIVRFGNILAPHERINDAFDACYAPRSFHLAGDLDLHDVGVDAHDRPIFVNTRFNCLATLSRTHSFKPIWKPPFVTGLLDGDKCHLNGLAMRNGRPAYVTAASRSDVVDGWRNRRADQGVVIDVEADAVVCEGLSMPHSPRMHRGELWLVNSGTGELGIVEGLHEGKGRFSPRAFCPGFLRGLAFHGKHAIVGLSKPRHMRFEGLALNERLKRAGAGPWCGVQIVDVDTGGCVDWLRIDGAVAELYDVSVIPGFARPMALTPFSEEAASLITFEPLAGPCGANRAKRSGSLPIP
jgi:uncharacterized protein (TIGR03032 family)